MFDSLDMVETAMSVEKEFSISITDEEMEDPMWDTATVQYLIDFVKGKMDANGNILKEYFNITEASKENGILQTSIANCIHGRSKSAGGFIWKLK